MSELKTAILGYLGQMGLMESVALQAVALLILIILLVRIYRRKVAEQASAEPMSPVRDPGMSKPEPSFSTNVSSVAREVKSEVVTSRVQPTVEPVAPEDSVLHRHYVANQEAQRLARTEPYPTDSVLHRHYDAMHCFHTDKSATSGAATQSVPCPVCSSNPALPQDSVLRRHFLAQLRAEVEASISPAPTDSVLRRHYQALVVAEMDKRLAALAG